MKNNVHKLDVKATLADLKNAEGALNKIFHSTELPIRSAYKLSLLVTKVQEQLKTLEDMRVRLVQKFGVKQEDGNQTVRPDKMTEFMAEMEVVLSEPAELNKITLTEADLAGVKLSPAEIANVCKIVEINV